MNADTMTSPWLGSPYVLAKVSALTADAATCREIALELGNRCAQYERFLWERGLLDQVPAERDPSWSEWMT